MPWASYNTPKIELIQYGRRIGKNVYLGCPLDGTFFLGNTGQRDKTN